MITKNKTILPNLEENGLVPFSWMTAPILITQNGKCYKKIIEWNNQEFHTAFLLVSKNHNLIIADKITSLKKQLTRSYNTKDKKR